MCLVGNQFDRSDQAFAAHLSYQRVVFVVPQTALHIGADLGGMFKQLLSTVNFQRLQRRRSRDRMARIGITVAENAELIAGFAHGFIHEAGHDSRAYGYIGCGQLFREAHQIGFDAHGA